MSFSITDSAGSSSQFECSRNEATAEGCGFPPEYNAQGLSMHDVNPDLCGSRIPPQHDDDLTFALTRPDRAVSGSAALMIPKLHKASFGSRRRLLTRTELCTKRLKESEAIAAGA